MTNKTLLACLGSTFLLLAGGCSTNTSAPPPSEAFNQNALEICNTSNHKMLLIVDIDDAHGVPGTDYSLICSKNPIDTHSLAEQLVYTYGEDNIVMDMSPSNRDMGDVPDICMDNPTQSLINEFVKSIIQNKDNSDVHIGCKTPDIRGQEFTLTK